MDIQLNKGVVELRKPTAGQRNKALIKSETPDGIKNTVFLVELLPYCIGKHPFGTVPVKQWLDSLEVDEYDKLIQGLAKILNPKGDVEKKSEEPSEVKDVKTAG